MERSSVIRDQATLLVFTLGAHREASRRRLLPARWCAQEHRLHRACLDNALSAGRDAGLRLEISSPTEISLPADTTFRRQEGAGFGTRLRRALNDTFESSTGPVVMVGTDVPGLTSGHLQASLGALHQDPEAVVIGPSPDGGFYLLASAKPLDDALGDVPWCCRQTLDHLRRALTRLGKRVVLLPTLRDLDHRRDLERWLADRHLTSGLPVDFRRWAALRRDLAAVLAQLSTPGDTVSHPLPLQHSFSTAPLRGPPQEVSPPIL